jgi:MYND finger
MGENNRFIKWQQQIDKFKKSDLYQRYLILYEKRERVPEVYLGSGKWSPANQVVDPRILSKRAFDGIIKAWKQKIHEAVPFIPEQFDCVVCGDPADNYCSGCYSAVYCNVECQANAWRLHQFSCINKTK